MRSLIEVLVLVALVCTASGADNGSPEASVEPFKFEPFKVLPNVLAPQLSERLVNETGDGLFTYSCGHWCDSDISSLRLHVAEALDLAPNQLGDLRLEETMQVDASIHAAWDGAVIVFLSNPRHGPTWLNGDGSRADLDHEDLSGSAVVLPTLAKAVLHYPVKLAVIPVLRQARPALDYYISTGLWNALVSTHRAGKLLGLDFFRAHTRYPLFWHACVWSALGSALLVLLGTPLLWRPLLALAEWIENRLPQKNVKGLSGAKKTVRFAEDVHERGYRPRGPALPTLLENRSMLPKLPIAAKQGDESSARLMTAASPCMTAASPCTPSTQHLSFMT